MFASVTELSKMWQPFHYFTPCCKTQTINTSKIFLYPMFIKLKEALANKCIYFNKHICQHTWKVAGRGQGDAARQMVALRSHCPLWGSPCCSSGTGIPGRVGGGREGYWWFSELLESFHPNNAFEILKPCTKKAGKFLLTSEMVVKVQVLWILQILVSHAEDTVLLSVQCWCPMK